MELPSCYPHWADAVTAVDATGAAVALKTDAAWCATATPVNEVEFIFAGGVYAENRRCTRLPDGPRPGEAIRDITKNLAKAKPGFVDRLIHGAGHLAGQKLMTFEKAASKLPGSVVIKAGK